jgi:radical SAM protein with 4Fe4S-binding SPASM domain
LTTALAHPRLGWATPGRTLPAPPAADSPPCAIGRRTCRVSPNGDLYPCSAWPESVGNILERPFAELWRGGEHLDRIRALRVDDLAGACAACDRAGYCGRCMALALLEHGDALGPSTEACRVARAKERALGLPAPQEVKPVSVMRRMPTPVPGTEA